MNILFWVLLAIFVAGAVIGYYKGVIKIVASLAASIITLALVVTLTPYVSEFILDTFPLEKAVQEKCCEMMRPEEGEDASEKEATSRDEQISWIEQSELPESIQQLLLANNNDEIYKALGVDSFADYVGSYLAKLIANIISFIVLSIIGTIVVQILLKTLGFVEKLPVIGGVNRLVGGALGLGISLLIVWCFFVVITLLYSTPFGKACFESIMDNGLLKYIYDNNILMNSLTKIKG